VNERRRTSPRTPNAPSIAPTRMSFSVIASEPKSADMALPDDITHWDGPYLEAWSGAWTPQEAAAHLKDVGVPWCVVGGWAIDLFLGRQTREHEDLEVAVLRDDFAAVRDHLTAFRFHVVGPGECRALAPGALPAADRFQNWLLDETANLWRMDVMLEKGDRETWAFRRHDAITAPRAEMMGERGGVRFLQPQGQLLYKAKLMRPKDEADFAAVTPHMTADARAWLRQALAHAHPGHDWIAKLA
jgi:hypothetical protein